MADGYGTGQVILIFGVPLLFAIGCGALMYYRHLRRKADQVGMPTASGSRLHAEVYSTRGLPAASDVPLLYACLAIARLYYIALARSFLTLLIRFFPVLDLGNN